MQVYDNEGNATGEINAVMCKWKSEFHKLFQGYDQNEFDKDFYDFASNEKKRLKCKYRYFNAKISLEEIQKVLSKANDNKAVVVDSLPNEVWKNNASCEFSILKCLFNKIFVIHVIPSAWKRAIIKPIPTNSTIDPRLPLQYRGIALLSTVYKLYTWY